MLFKEVRKKKKKKKRQGNSWHLERGWGWIKFSFGF